MKISLVVVVDEALGMGRDNHLLCHLSSDLKHFKQLTMGKPILMGRKTFESIGKALPGRRNVVLTHQPLIFPDVEVVKTLDEVWQLLKSVPEVMVIGGASIFAQVLPLAQTIYLTRIQHVFDADVFFPTLNPGDWQEKLLGEHPADEKNAYAVRFCCLESMRNKEQCRDR